MGILDKLFRKQKGQSSLSEEPPSRQSTPTRISSLNPAETFQVAPTGKICAICGATCAVSSIQCDKCGSGVFSSPKTVRESNQPPTLAQMPDKAHKKTIRFAKYRKFFIDLGLSLGTTDPDIVHARHKAYCAKCNLQFTREALDMLCALGPGGMFSGARTVVMGATNEGNDLRAGKCPRCGHTKFSIITDGEKSHREVETPKEIRNQSPIQTKTKINAPKGVYCILCQSRYSIADCINPRIPEGRIITFVCPKCKVPRAYDPDTDKGL